jgi:hypothetical protein
MYTISLFAFYARTLKNSLSVYAVGIFRSPQMQIFQNGVEFSFILAKTHSNIFSATKKI